MGNFADTGSSEEPNFWLNTRTGEVEDGPQSNALDRIGPFASREEAARGKEILAERARAWAEEDAAEDA